jgi:mannose-6-phosphate isomerase-like protein (cupin superfamily)
MRASMPAAAPSPPSEEPMPDSAAFSLSALVDDLDTSRRDFAEFFRSASLSMTVLYRPAGAPDDQTPHTEDEVYYIASGKGWLQAGDEEHELRAESIIYVAAGVDHQFHDVTEDLRILVFWAPPRHSNRPE